METETVIISKEEYENLKRRSRLLSALEVGGVDNWEWYGESTREFYREEYGDDD